MTSVQDTSKIPRQKLKINGEKNEKLKNHFLQNLKLYFVKMSHHHGFFCQQCLSSNNIFPGTCYDCDSGLSYGFSLKLNEAIIRCHTDETGVYHLSKNDNDGETVVLISLFQQGSLPQDYPSLSPPLIMRNTSPIHSKSEFHAALDFNLMVWKSPVLRDLTGKLCEPLAALARTRKITVTIARVILLLVGNCLRDKKEVLRLMDSVVYPETQTERDCIKKL